MESNAIADVKPLAPGVERIIPRARELCAKRNDLRNEVPVQGSWFARRIITPLLSGIALVASYGCDTSGPENTDSENDADVVQDVDEEADAPQEDSVSPDVEDRAEAEDSAHDSDVPDVLPDVDAHEDAEPDSDVAEDVGDVPEEAGCVETRREEAVETAQPDVGDPAEGGSTQTRADVDVIVSREGEGCDGAAETRSFERIDYTFAPPLADFIAAVRMGIITSNLADSPLYKVIRRDGIGCIITGEIIAGDRIGMGMPTTEVTDGVYLVTFSAVGETAGVKWIDISIWDLRRGEWVSGERVNEGNLFRLPNGNRGMPTWIDILNHRASMHILGPDDHPLCEGMRLVRESDGMNFIVRQNLPEGWSFFVER